MPEAPEVSASTSSHPQQGARGRGSGSHRRGRPRRGGQRNGQSNEESSQAARVNEASAGGHSTTRISGETPSTRGSTPASTPASTQSSAPRGRGRRGGAGRGRGGAAVQTSTLVSRRAFGGHLTSQTDASAGVDASHAAGLSGDAPEFVPGQQFVPSRLVLLNVVPSSRLSCIHTHHLRQLTDFCSQAKACKDNSKGPTQVLSRGLADTDPRGH